MGCPCLLIPGRSVYGTGWKHKLPADKAYRLEIRFIKLQLKLTDSGKRGASKLTSLGICVLPALSFDMSRDGLTGTARSSDSLIPDNGTIPAKLAAQTGNGDGDAAGQRESPRPLA